MSATRVESVRDAAAAVNYAVDAEVRDAFLGDLASREVPLER